MPPQVQTAPTIELETQAIDNKFATLKEQFDRVGNVTTEQKQQKEAEELVDSIIKDKNPFKNVGIEDIWIEDDLFDSNDLQSIIETSRKITNEITPNPLIDLDIATPPDSDDEIYDDIDFTITDSQLVEGDDTQVDRDTEPFVNFTVTDSHIVDENNDDNIDFTIADSQLVEGNDTQVDRDTESFFDFTVSDSRPVDSEDGIETINVMMNDDIIIPNTNTTRRGTGPPKRKK